MTSEQKKPSRIKRKNNSSAFKVLAVDDEEVMGYLIQRVVDELGYKVDWVRDCQTALSKMKNQKYDVIVSDFRLPGMTGELFYNKIIHQNAALARKTIFITGDAVNRHALAFFKRMKLPYFAKPFNIDVLKRAIQEMVSSE
ncbi:response regulator [bacterium]|nr:response regulator [bacterium]